jgi:tetratricopeptide (TPR) repeat protein
MGSGDYEKAAAAYLSVRSTRFEALVAYDLGNVYARLGEVEAAAERYAHARSRGDGPIIRDAWYNEGLALYEAGRFEDSYRAFRRALAIDPADEDARRNLELAYRDWKKRELSPPSSVAPARRTGSADLEELQRLFRRLSTGLWRPGASLPAPPSARDY